MRSEASTVAQYLKSLPADRRTMISAVRKTILAHLPAGYQESMNWGMIAYEVPLSICPDTYNGQPLMYAALASQKNYCAVYLISIYATPESSKEFEAAYRATGKRYDVGKSCVRFRKLEDLPLELIGKAIAEIPMESYVEHYLATRGGPRKRRAASPRRKR